MCTSPHEMDSARIEEIIAEMERQIELYKDEPAWKHTVRIWEGRIPHFQAVLKERADNGTY